MTVGRERRRNDLPEPRGGWEPPWPAVFEVAEHLDTARWTLVGGLMVQAHAIAHDITATRPTIDVDVLLHVEVETTVAADAHQTLTALGYVLQQPFDRHGPHYRYQRGHQRIDVMAADHPAPTARQTLGGRKMFPVDGGTQALRRTMIYTVAAPDQARHNISVPDELGALVLKGAAHLADHRDRDRHLFDAAVLAACITDHAAQIERLGGSDHQRIAHLTEHLADPRHPAWLALTPAHRTGGQDTLRILSAGPRRRTPFGSARPRV